MANEGKVSYIPLREEDYKQTIERLRPFNEKAGKRRYTLPGMFKFLLKQRYQTDVITLLNSVSDEELQQYFQQRNK